MPIGAVANPHFADFVDPKEDRANKTHHLLGAIRKITQSSITEDFNGKLNLRTNRRLRRSAKRMGVSCSKNAVFLSGNRKTKGGNAGCAHG